MRRFDSRIGAAVLVALAAVYMVSSIALGRSAAAEPPPDLALRASDAGLDVWKSVGASLSGATFADIRSPQAYAAYHVAGAVNVPDASLEALRRTGVTGAVIVVAARDDQAQRFVGAARAADPRGKYFFLQNGVRDWYLTFELPVALFNEQPPPRGYDDALVRVKQYIASRDSARREPARMALFELARMNYQPTLLKAAGKAKTAGGAKKKIAGGCGG